MDHSSKTYPYLARNNIRLLFQSLLHPLSRLKSPSTHIQHSVLDSWNTEARSAMQWNLEQMLVKAPRSFSTLLDVCENMFRNNVQHRCARLALCVACIFVVKKRFAAMRVDWEYQKLFGLKFNKKTHVKDLISNNVRKRVVNLSSELVFNYLLWAVFITLRRFTGYRLTVHASIHSHRALCLFFVRECVLVIVICSTTACSAVYSRKRAVSRCTHWSVLCASVRSRVPWLACPREC